MDITFLISLLPHRQEEYNFGLPDDPFTQCAATIPLQADMTRVVDETRLQTLQWMLKLLIVVTCISLLGRCTQK